MLASSRSAADLRAEIGLAFTCRLGCCRQAITCRLPDGGFSSPIIDHKDFMEVRGHDAEDRFTPPSMAGSFLKPRQTLSVIEPHMGMGSPARLLNLAGKASGLASPLAILKS